jgi:hypothetical protein
MELDFDGIEVAKRVRDIQLTISNDQILEHGLGRYFDVILLFC